MRAADVDTVITPGKIYRALGKRADCGGCLPSFLQVMGNSDNLQVLCMTLRGLRRVSSKGER